MIAVMMKNGEWNHREGESVIINTKIGLITILHKVGYKCESTATAVAAIATATATVPSAVAFPRSRQIEFGFDWINLKKIACDKFPHIFVVVVVVGAAAAVSACIQLIYSMRHG